MADLSFILTPLGFAPAALPGHRYWRITNIAGFTSGGNLDWAVDEFQLWENSSTRADTSSTTQTTNGAIVFGTLDRLLDGSFATYIEFFPFDTSKWIRWDFGVGVTKAVTGFKHAHRGGGGAAQAHTQVRLQYSDDDSSWTTFGDATGLARSDDALSAFIPFI